MYKFIFFCCINIISLIHAAPINSDPKINEILQLDFLNKCPAILNNNINLHKSEGGLSHCKNVSIGNPPQQIDLTNLNEFYCVGLLAADIQLCTGNKTNKQLKNYDDLKLNIDKIKNEKPEKICNELKQLTLFDETKNVPNLKKWIDILDQNLHNATCVGLCTDIDDGNTNLYCSMIYYINNKISYATIPVKHEIPLVQKVDTVVPSTINTQQKPTAKTVLLSDPSNTNVDKKNINHIFSTDTPAITTPANIKDNTPKPVEKIVETIQVVNEPKTPKQAPVVVVPTTTTTTTTELAPIPKKDETVAQVKTVQITEESKLPATVNEIPSVEENPKIPSNVESSSVSSSTTISGVRDDLADDYFEEVEEINKENEDQLLPQTNSRKETIEILTSDQDRHRMPSEEGEDMEESNFFSYFMFVSVMFIAGYVVYHNKQKIMALLLEGRRDRNSRRRPNTASYRKLNSNLEEAVTSKCSGSASHVIY